VISIEQEASVTSIKLDRRALIATLLGAALASASPALAADKITIGAVGSPTGSYWPFFIAKAKGFFAAENIEPDLVFAQSSAAIMQQLAAGSLDITIGGGLVDPVRAIEKGAPLAIVRTVIQAPPYTLVAKPAIKTIADLKGKIISIGGPKDITRIYVEAIVAPSGLKDGDYDLVFAGSTGARYSALQTGAIDATLLTAPFNFYSKTAGFTDLAETSKVLPDLPFVGLVVNRNWAGAKPQVLQRFLSAFGKSIAFFQDGNNRAESVKILADASRLKLDEVEKSYDYFRDGNYFNVTGKVSKRSLNKLIAALVKLGDVPAQLTVERLLMPGVVEVVD
jgi:ABC-type nitrate/sulfonate/bicarbonate transport system substrate-binding protein